MLLVGNSSSGIIESASLGVNAVNIGPRQSGRLRCGPSVIDVPATPERIRRGIRQALKRPRPRPSGSLYGTGQASTHIAAILERLQIDERLLRKELTY
jgi:UDP-N-acetylglucosamine 2-epimerase